MALKSNFFVFCLALVGLVACGESMELADRPATPREVRIQSFLATERVFSVMVPDAGSTPYAADAKLTLSTADTFELQVTWTTGAKETITGDFDRNYVVTDETWDLVFDEGGFMLRQQPHNGELRHCADMLFESGPLKSVLFVLCDR